MSDRDDLPSDPQDLSDLPAALLHDAVAGAAVVEELRAAAGRAKARSAHLSARTSAVLERSNQVMRLAADGELGAARLVQLEAENAGLRRAMETRGVIEQAKGMVMASTGCDADAAFQVLVQQSQHENRKLVEVARDLVRTHERSAHEG